MRSTKCIRLVCLAMLVCCSPRSFANAAVKDDASANLHWREPSRVMLDLGGGKSGNVAKWTIRLGERGDFLLDVATPTDSGTSEGQILVLGGQAMAVSGLTLEKGYEMDALDMPAFHFQLLYGLLESLFPDGPQSVTGSHTVEHTEDSAPIPVGTASATGEFDAPWSVKGTVTRRDEHAIDYDLGFTFTVDRDASTTFTLNLAGNWNGGDARPSIGNDFVIENWVVYLIGPYQADADGDEATPYGAQPLEVQFRTAGELRAALARSSSDSDEK